MNYAENEKKQTKKKNFCELFLVTANRPELIKLDQIFNTVLFSGIDVNDKYLIFALFTTKLAGYVQSIALLIPK